MKDSKVSSNNENSSEGSTLKRFKTLTDLGQSLDTPLLTEGSKRTGPTTGIYPVNVLAMTPHSHAAVPGPTEVFTEDPDFANEIDATQNEVPALQAPQTPTTSTFAAHLEENIKPKLEQWREYNKINKNKIPDEAIIKRSKIEALIQTVTTALSIFHGHPTLLDILHFANRIAVISEQEWKSVQEASMNETLTALNKTINALEQAAKSLQTTHNDTLAYWEEYEHDQLETLKKTSAVLIIEHMLGSLDKADTAFSEKVDASVEHAFKNGTVAFNNELDTLLLKKVKLHKSERFITLEEKSKQATKAAQKAFNYSLHKLPTLKEKTQSSRAIQYIIPELFSESGRALKNAASDFDKAQYALKKPESTTNKMIRATYTMGKKTGSLLKSTIELMDEGIVERVISRVKDASHDTLDYTRTKLPSLAKRGAYKLQILGISALKNWEESVIPSSEDSINFDATLSVTPLEILAATQDLLVVTLKMLASAHEANKAVKALEKKQEPTDSDLKTLPGTLSRDFKLATSVEQQLNVLTRHAIQAVMEIEREALTKKSLKSDSKLKDKEKSISTLEEAKTAALRVAPHVQTHTSDEAFKALMDATLADIDPRYKRGAERKLISLSNTIKPAAKLLFEAATDLMNTAKLPTEKETQLEVMISALKNVENKTRDVKTTIKLALTQMTGSALHNYSHRGLLAKDIGEFIASEKAAYLKNNPGTDSDIDGAVEQMLSKLQSDLTTPEDSQGKVLGKWIKMAVKDAENDDISWPASLEAILSQHPKIKQYLHEWGAKKFNYNLLLGMVSATAQDSARTLERLVSLHPNRNLLRPRMAYLKVLLAPLTIGLVIRSLGQATRVGENPQSAIKKFLKREAGKLAFRLFTSVLPSAAITALSGALTFSGFYKGGKFNEEYLKLAKKRMALNLVSAGIEQPFMLLKTHHLAQSQQYFSPVENIPESSSTPSFDVQAIDDLANDMDLKIEHSDAQPLETDTHEDSSSTPAANTDRTPRTKRSVNPTGNTDLRANDEDTKTASKSNAPKNIASIDKTLIIDITQRKITRLQQSVAEIERDLSLLREEEASPSAIDEKQKELDGKKSELNEKEKELELLSKPITAEAGVETTRQLIKPKTDEPAVNINLRADDDRLTADNSIAQNTPPVINQTEPLTQDRNRLTLLMRSIDKIKKNISRLKEEGAPESEIDEKQKELNVREQQLTAFSKRLPAELIIETTREYVKSDIYARNLLEEMKAYYSKAVNRIWNDFDPDQKISFSFYRIDPNDPSRRITHRGKTDLIDFFNGRVKQRMISLGCSSPITFEGSQARTAEVVNDLNIGSRGYTPGLWSKIKALNSLVTPEDKSKDLERPRSTDIVTVKVYTDATTFKYKKISLDDYIRRRYLTASEKASGLNNNPDVTWPTHYTATWQKTFTTQEFHNDYMRGDTAIKTAALSTPTLSNSVKALATKMWDHEDFSNRISAHPQLKAMTPDSTITFEEYRFGVKKQTSMTFLEFITEGRQLIKNSDYTLIIDPPGLTLDDPLLEDMITTNVAARKVVAHLYEVSTAAQKVKIPHPLSILQEELENAVINHQTGTDFFKYPKLTDRIKINYTETWKYEPADIVGNIKFVLGKTGVLPEEIKETKEFTIFEIMQKKHIRHAIANSYKNIYFDPNSVHDLNVLSKLATTDWQVHLEGIYQQLKDDPEFFKNWKTVIAPILYQHIETSFSEKPFHTVICNDTPIAGVYAVSKPNGRFELRSLQNNTHFEFRDVGNMIAAFNMGYESSEHLNPVDTLSPSLQPGQQVNEFYSWLTPHMSEGQKEAVVVQSALPYVPTLELADPNDLTGKYSLGQNAEDFASTLFTLCFDQLLADADALTKSNAELIGHAFFQGFTDAGPYLAGATSFLSGAIGYGVGLGVAAVPFAELLISDSAQESREIFLTALINTAIDYKLDLAIKPSIKKFIKTGIPFLSNSFKAIKKTANLFEPSSLKVTKLDSWTHVTHELALIGKTKYKTAKLLSEKFTYPKYDNDMNLIPYTADRISTALLTAHVGTVQSSPFVAKKGDLIVFIATPGTTPQNEVPKVKHVMICIGDGLFSGVGNDVLDPTLSSEKQILTAEELIKLRERGIANTDDVSDTTPLTIRVLTPKDDEVEPEKPISQLYIPSKQYHGRFGDKALWQNRTAFDTFESYYGSSELRIKNRLSHTITVNCTVSDQGIRWRIDWSPELLRSSDISFIESDSLGDILVNFETLLENCQDNHLAYEVTLPGGFNEAGYLGNFAHSVSFENSPHVLDKPLPETNGYWDNTLNGLSQEQWADAVDNYAKGKTTINLSSESDFFNFLITFHRDDNPDSQHEYIYKVEHMKQKYEKIISSRTIAGILNEIMISAGYLPPEGMDKSPFSKQGLSHFLGKLANALTSENSFELDHDTLNPSTLNLYRFNTDLIRMTTFKGFSHAFSESMLLLLYKNKKAI